LLNIWSQKCERGFASLKTCTTSQIKKGKKEKNRKIGKKRKKEKEIGKKEKGKRKKKEKKGKKRKKRKQLFKLCSFHCFPSNDYNDRRWEFVQQLLEFFSASRLGGSLLIGWVGEGD
jgi:hypothetical protein